MCVVFISIAMRKPSPRHDKLLRLVMDIADDTPLTALSTLQVCNVNMFNHVISAVPRDIIRPFIAERDAAVIGCLEVVHGCNVSPRRCEHGRVRTLPSHALSLGAGGASLHSMDKHGGGSHLGTYYRIVGPLFARLLMMGGPTPRRAIEHLLFHLDANGTTRSSSSGVPPFHSAYCFRVSPDPRE